MDNLTHAERMAIEATRLPAFPINVDEIRKNVELLLGEFGRYGFFDEYTDHSFKHVRGMLAALDWVIPPSAKQRLTRGDWLFLTLAIYFHDLGLLISRAEYSLRNEDAEFRKFVELPPIQGKELEEYRAKLSRLPSEQQDRVNYQEYVRFNHGKRVKAWIEGALLDKNDNSAEMRKVIAGLIGKLSSSARGDLARLCNSHTQDDIEDTEKYRLFKPYGQSKDEAVNLQYVAIILRTVDLIHITEDRAPSVLYQLISPSDPLSQLEWQRQSAVVSVIAATARDKDGQADASLESDTIQVHAHFRESGGFFGLTNYLSYVRSQLRASYDANRKSANQIPDAPRFPWRDVDDSRVEAEGFLTRIFEFELDQQRILDLLTGHTLYNDANVVLRELTQNALDAVRLQANIEGKSAREIGKISINWNSHERVLEIIDNGTGMTQEVIERHLLKVGSSRYQDARFREEYPEFSSISRFGIGVLSAFMVSDNVEITTCALSEDQARTITLRSVHGKYLIKLHDKIRDRSEIDVYPHGTRVRLGIRPTAKIGDITQIARSWLVFPACQVSVKIDSDEAVNIGYLNPKEALEDLLRSHFQGGSRDFEVKECSAPGVDMAYLMVRDELFKDWSFVSTPDSRIHMYSDEPYSPISTCVEGVAVDFSTPGFNSKTIVAVVNATGKNAPKTNVARSALEDTEEYRDMLTKVYGLYSRHVSDEVERLSGTTDYSTSRAIQQAPFILSSLISNGDSVVQAGLLDEQLSAVKMLIGEKDGKRSAVSISDLESIGEFWRVESPLISSVEQFVRESPRDISAESILERLQDASYRLPNGLTISSGGNSPYIDKAVRRKFDPVEIVANVNLRRLSVRWAKITNGRRWMSSEEIYSTAARVDRAFWERFHISRREMGGGRSESIQISIPLQEVIVSGMDGFGAVQLGRETFLSPEDSVAIFLRAQCSIMDDLQVRRLCVYVHLMELFYAHYQSFDSAYLSSNLTRVMSTFGMDMGTEIIDVAAFAEAISGSTIRYFDPYAWRRRLEEA
ncbi:ATP-binding protein [Stenotrophomonas cyclobalanopsidis]|uniref:HD domain-containing protein n=1 Tax=Stenotrophomonas cyclobalanopsidis TaxID=2771362 RepID=UPI0028A8D7A1|nr:ATP-binding protein [Stenotrophomonas cyclobalanopsidis]